MTIFLQKFVSLRDIIVHFGDDHNISVPASSITNEYDSDGLPILSTIVITIPPLLVVRRPDFTVDVSMTHDGQGRPGATRVRGCFWYFPIFSPNVLLPTNFFLFMHLCQCFVFQYEDPNLVIVDYASPQSTSIQGQTTIELGLARVPAILGQLTNLRLQVHAREMHV